MAHQVISLFSGAAASTAASPLRALRPLFRSIWMRPAPPHFAPTGAAKCCLPTLPTSPRRSSWPRRAHAGATSHFLLPALRASRSRSRPTGDTALRSGLTIPRSETLMHMMRIIEDVLPRVVLIENVPGFAGQGRSRWCQSHRDEAPQNQQKARRLLQPLRRNR